MENMDKHMCTVEDNTIVEKRDETHEEQVLRLREKTSENVVEFLKKGYDMSVLFGFKFTEDDTRSFEIYSSCRAYEYLDILKYISDKLGFEIIPKAVNMDLSKPNRDVEESSDVQEAQFQ